MTLSERYFVPAVPHNRIAPKSSDAKHALAMQQSIERIEDLRRQMYQIVDEHLSAYADGTQRPDLDVDIPSFWFLKKGLDREELGTENYERIIRSRVYAAINEHLRQNEEGHAGKSGSTKKPRECEAVFA